MSHPGDWEHRTLRSIQPSRVLARLIDDEWNLYENRVAVRLVDHLLAYVARRLEELSKVEGSLRARKENVDKCKTSFWRVGRIMELWADALDSKIEDDLRATRQNLELAQRDLQALLDAPLYQRVPRRASVALSLRPTNILVNDAHYRKVAALWRAWVKLGHKRQETQEQRAARRQIEAQAWDRFVLHLVVRAFFRLSWNATLTHDGWRLSRQGYATVDVVVDAHGVIVLRAAEDVLRLLPLCASFAEKDDPGLREQLRGWDGLGEFVAVYVHPPVVWVRGGDQGEVAHLPARTGPFGRGHDRSWHRPQLPCAHFPQPGHRNCRGACRQGCAHTSSPSTASGHSAGATPAAVCSRSSPTAAAKARYLTPQPWQSRSPHSLSHAAQRAHHVASDPSGCLPGRTSTWPSFSQTGQTPRSPRRLTALSTNGRNLLIAARGASLTGCLVALATRVWASNSASFATTHAAMASRSLRVGACIATRLIPSWRTHLQLAGRVGRSRSFSCNG